MGVITCCYKCEKRHKLCHSTCKEYIKQKEDLSVVNEKIKKALFEAGLKGLQFSNSIDITPKERTIYEKI